ncbi:hypothetical protein A2U01_0004662, partial [Trifolium medium]|nr:hypothetical protein [Trifolium medium]
MEQPVDFKTLRANGYDVKKFFEDQGWMGYFEMINGPVYTVLVKDFWPRCDVVTQEDADQTDIRSGVTGYEVTLTQSIIAQVLKLPNQGIFKTFTPTSGKLSNFVSRIAMQCYIDEEAEPTNKVNDMKLSREFKRLKLMIFWKNRENHSSMDILYHTRAPIPKQPPTLFSNEPKEVVLEYMRIMKDEGVIITGADIAQAYPEDKQEKMKRIVKVKQEKVDEETTSGNTSASRAGASEAKSTEEKKASEATDTEDIGASEAKDTENSKGKAVAKSVAKPVSEKKEKAFKKPRSVKKRAPRIPRRYVVSDSDEEIEEEQPMFKRKRTEQAEPEKAQSASEDMDTDADTGNPNSINDNVPVFQAHTPPISSSLNQPIPETNDDIDPTLLQPINIIHP